MNINTKLIKFDSVLIAEDGKIFSESAKRIIHFFGATEIYQAYTPDEAVEILKNNNYHFDLILVDYFFSYGNVKNKTGEDIIKNIREHNPNVLIIAFSYDPKGNVLLSKAGATTIVGKSKNLKELNQWLEEHINKTKAL